MFSLPDLQEAADIERVVWVDDVFAEPQDEALRVAIQAKLRVLYDNGYTPKHTAFKHIKIESPESIREKQIETVLDTGEEESRTGLGKFTPQNSILRSFILAICITPGCL